MTPKEIQKDREKIKELFHRDVSPEEFWNQALLQEVLSRWSVALDAVEATEKVNGELFIEVHQLRAENERLRSLFCKTTGGYDPVGVDDTSNPPGPGSDATS